MSRRPRPQLTHMALFTRDLDRMVEFYTKVMGLTITDEGSALSAPVRMVFMSANPGEHHQFVLLDGRADSRTTSVAQQISFLVESLDELRAMRDQVSTAGLHVKRTVTHGNAWSFYFDDPEGNQIEIYTHTPWYIPQPHAYPFDLSLTNEEIVKQTEAHVREDPQFMPAAEREKVMEQMMGQAE